MMAVGSSQDDASRIHLRQRVWFGAATLAVLVLAWVGGAYGKTDMDDIYGSDGTSYMDCARAIGHGDFVSALNPLWSQGYPALIALVRPLFRPGMEGDWLGVHVLNVAIVLGAWMAFLWCLGEVVTEIQGQQARWDWWMWFAAFAAFVTTQMGLDSLAHTTPDKLVALLFFVSCGLLLRLLRRPNVWLSVELGAALGLGFITKSIFEVVGVVTLAVAGIVLSRRRRAVRFLVPAAALFVAVLLGYGAMLSRVVGRPTLGESGALNYAWHVNRLHKWVHWEGGADSAEEAWMSGRVARFAKWESDPPEFGLPIHPDVSAGSTPKMYVFHAPFHGSYVPYYDPAYWYEGYRHFFRWRYQAISVVKNVERLMLAIALEPWFWAVGIVLGICAWKRERRGEWLRPGGGWAVVAVAAMATAVYLPVHIEGRYVSAFLAVLAMGALMVVAPSLRGSRTRYRAAVALLGLGFVLGLVKDQRAAWSRAVHGYTHEQNAHWKMGEAMARVGLAPGSQIGVIFWGANLDSDWASMAQVEITSEIASGPDEDAFWALPAEGQRAVLERFRGAGAVAVVSRDVPRNARVEWVQPTDAGLWVHRF